jgi:DNA-binding transcriptional ArsR family regulator
MDPVTEPELDAALRALAHPDRRAILRTIGAGRLPAGEVADRTALAASTASEHLRVLRTAGLILLDARGTWRFYRAAPGALATIAVALKDLEPNDRGADNGTSDRAFRHQRA